MFPPEHWCFSCIHVTQQHSFLPSRSFLGTICKTVEIYLCISSMYSWARRVKSPGSIGPAMHGQCNLYLYTYRLSVKNACGLVHVTSCDDRLSFTTGRNWGAISAERHGMTGLQRVKLCRNTWFHSKKSILSDSGQFTDSLWMSLSSKLLLRLTAWKVETIWF